MRSFTAAVIMFAAAITSAQSPFLPLTPESLQQALAQGQEGKTTPPLDVIIDRMNRMVMVGADGQSTSADAMINLAQNAPFSVTIITPYRKAVTMAADAARRYAPMPQISIDALNQTGITVLVSAGQNFSTAGVIEDLVIKKDAAIVRPATKKVTPTQIQNRMGASRDIAEGAFTFPFETIPPAPFTIVCIGASGNYEITVIPSDLFALK